MCPAIRRWWEGTQRTPRGAAASRSSCSGRPWWMMGTGKQQGWKLFVFNANPSETERRRRRRKRSENRGSSQLIAPLILYTFLLPISSTPTPTPTPTSTPTHITAQSTCRPPSAQWHHCPTNQPVPSHIGQACGEGRGARHRRQLTVRGRPIRWRTASFLVLWRGGEEWLHPSLRVQITPAPVAGAAAQPA